MNITSTRGLRNEIQIEMLAQSIIAFRYLGENHRSSKHLAGPRQSFTSHEAAPQASSLVRYPPVSLFLSHTHSDILDVVDEFSVSEVDS